MSDFLLSRCRHGSTAPGEKLSPGEGAVSIGLSQPSPAGKGGSLIEKTQHFQRSVGKRVSYGV